ncbi:hypothetical protein NLO86_26500, partial [Pseudomonas savastanoi]|nr:hypothetical protein [Pseudomonas savastanoi]
PTRGAVELETLKWVDWFNHRRLLEPIGHIPPVEAEAIYYQQLKGSPRNPGRFITLAGDIPVSRLICRVLQ